MAQTAEVDAFADEFVAEWESPDTDKIVPYFNVPFVLINAAMGFVLPVMDEGTLRDVVSGIVKERIAESYARTDLLGRETKMLASNLATVSSTEVAYDTSGAELRRFGSTYTFIKSDDGWRIASVTSYDAQE